MNKYFHVLSIQIFSQNLNIILFVIIKEHQANKISNEYSIYMNKYFHVLSIQIL